MDRASARLLAEVACAAWLLDLRELEPLPVLTEGATRLLTSSEHVRFLAKALPAAQRRKWRLLFTTARDGLSFSRFSPADRPANFAVMSLSLSLNPCCFFCLRNVDAPAGLFHEQRRAADAHLAGRGGLRHMFDGRIEAQEGEAGEGREASREGSQDNRSRG